MQKVAKYDSPAWVLLPGHRFLAGKNPDMSKFPRLFNDEQTNTTAWGTIGAMASVGTLAAVLSGIANKKAKKEINEVREQVRKNKIRALSAVSIPKASYKDEEEDEDEEKSLKKKSSMGWTTTGIPVAAAIATAAMVHNRVGNKAAEKFDNELDEEIAKQRAKLDSLYAKMLKMYSSGDNFKLSKRAAAKDNPGLYSRAKTGFMMALVGAGVLPALAAYYYTKKHSDELASEKVLKEQLLAANLTNIPDSVLLQLDPHIKTRNA